MVACVVGLARFALDHDPFRTTIFSRPLWFHVVLSISPSWKPSFTILKHLAADIAGQRLAASILDSLSDGMRLGRYLLESGRGRSLYSAADPVA